MRVAFLVALVGLAIFAQAEAGWWRTSLRWVGDLCDEVFGKKLRKRRELSEDVDPDTLKDIDNLCKKSHMQALTPDGIPFEMAKIAFEKNDVDGDDALTAAELDEFVNAIEVFKYCMIHPDGAGN